MDKERTEKVEQIKRLQIQVDQALQIKMMIINELSNLSAMKHAEKQSVAQLEESKKTHDQKWKAVIQWKNSRQNSVLTDQISINIISLNGENSFNFDDVPITPRIKLVQELAERPKSQKTKSRRF